MELSFRQAVHVLQHTEKRSDLASLDACSDLTISKNARIACVVNLEKLFELLEEAWVFSIAFDMSTHMSSSYLDIRFRLHLDRVEIVNEHLLVISVYERHLAEVILTLQQRPWILCIRHGKIPL